MIVSLHVVTHASGGVLLARYYGPRVALATQQSEWLKKLRDATAGEWRLLVEDVDEQVAAVGEVQVVFKLIGDVVLLLAGTEEHDALLLLELSRAIDKTMRAACRIPASNRVSAERRILQNYANLCLLIDEHIDDGDIDHLDSDVVLKLLRMQPSK